MGSAKGEGKEGARRRRSRTWPLTDEAHDKYHGAQADRTRDTAQKRLARRAGDAFVGCPCGSQFPAAVKAS